MIDIEKLLRKGHEVLRQRHRAEESAKLGTLRGGNSGCVLEDGRVVGKCQRLSLARSLGIEASAEEHRDLMFAAGHGSEDLEVAVLEAAKGPGDRILREADVPVVWDLDGTTVMGRPDIVLADSEGHPVHGLELKLVSSYYTALDVKIKGEPKLPHLIQLGLYSWRLGVSFTLLYVSRVDWHFQQRDKKLVPPNHPLVDYNNKGEPKKLYPFYAAYQTLWDPSGRLLYRSSPEGRWVKSIVTQAGIEAYYRGVIQARDSRVLPPIPDNLTSVGGPMPWAQCSYCDFAKTCAGTTDYEQWMTKAEAQFGRIKSGSKGD